MSRIKQTLQQLQSQQRQALVPYITAGDPLADVTVPLMHTLVKAGASMLELGIPFSDPMAEGPVIQAAMQRALDNGMTLKKVLQFVSEFRQQDQTTPVVLMGYLNPIETMGYQTFAEQASQAGVDGLITVDLPPEEGQALTSALRAVDIDPIFLLSPTTTPERRTMVCEAASGFLYYVSLKGVTGAGHFDIDSVKHNVAQIRSQCDLPIGVGFGISDAQTAKAVASVADAVIIGSALVKTLANCQDTETVLATAEAFLKRIHQGQ